MSAPVRCAIYTRKSSEEGLEQGFNSLDAQREAGEAFVMSQVGEGWRPLPTRYDDGGFSGGNIDRPGLKALLADVAAKRIDVVVVYKVDRLTRSLADFAKIVELFDAHGVAFVAVTQAFNTTTSMGRLTLNVLLSFAQFEREVTGERIRDKIAASKAKGMWMGGNLPLGYDAPTDPRVRTLVLNPGEAETVRTIFRRYLELGSVHALCGWLDQEGIRSKQWVTRRGREIGGLPFTRGALFHLLKNRTYIGEIPHREASHPAAHTPIIDRETFLLVQGRLAAHARDFRERPIRVGAQLLTGRIFDADGQAMSPTFTRKGPHKLYRYYVSAPLQQGVRRPSDDDSIRRVPADAIERIVSRGIAQLGGGDHSEGLERVEIHPTTVQFVVRREAFFRSAGDPEAELGSLRRRLGRHGRIAQEIHDPALARVTLECRLKFRGGRVWLEAGGAPLTTKPDPTLINGLRSAHRIASAMGEGEGGYGRPETLHPHCAPASAYERKLAALAFLAPDIQSAIVEGRHPPGLTLQGVLDGGVPPLWEDQRRAFGFQL
jgi:DNA invertase Pin-like site-specific DNA recombinase